MELVSTVFQDTIRSSSFPRVDVSQAESDIVLAQGGLSIIRGEGQQQLVPVVPIKLSMKLVSGLWTTTVHCWCILLTHNALPLLGSGRHSLWVLATYISGSTPFPEFSAVLMLDDIQVGYFDSVTGRFRENGEEGAELDLGQQAGYIQQEMLSSMTYQLEQFKQRFNLTAGVHVQQRLTGCEVLQDGQPALIMFRDGSNGQDADSLMYNMTHFTYAGGDGWEIQWDAMKKTYFQTLYSNIYLPLCVQTLKHLLDQNKRLVKRRVRPRVRFITKPLSGGARVTCLATDFYPRHINLTLLRDGQPVDEDQLTGGEVLPNGNGLYQVRKTLTVTDEELQRKHSYTCTTAHLSLDNRLEVSWRAEFSRSHRVHIISAPAGLAITAVLLLLLLWWRKRRRTLRSEGIAMETQVQPGEE
ncbi:hereditary hemochromatosis protein homolog [Scomber japonicus]|uniref:hereditary hemochromatosis protein homolog n=1 Tax=Scomber japonicus TaxID=13676 RepID=UPI002306BB3F|nr:hereditary hemochromatosis protein homolog [Scomber japonicus]